MDWGNWIAWKGNAEADKRAKLGACAHPAVLAGTQPAERVAKHMMLLAEWAGYQCEQLATGAVCDQDPVPVKDRREPAMPPVPL
eukprot:765181-Amphidinium_carterae.1